MTFLSLLLVRGSKQYSSMNQEGLNVEIRCYKRKKCSEDREWESKWRRWEGKKERAVFPVGNLNVSSIRGATFFTPVHVTCRIESGT